MKPKITTETPIQLELERHGAILAKIINRQHALVTLADRIIGNDLRNCFQRRFIQATDDRDYRRG